MGFVLYRVVFVAADGLPLTCSFSSREYALGSLNGKEILEQGWVIIVEVG